MRHLMERFKSAMTTFGLFLAGALLPDRAKRILLLTSLHMQLVREGVFHEEALDRLNCAMNLASRQDALLFPAHVYRSIWEHTALKECVNPIATHDFATSCLPFDVSRQIAEDIAKRSVPHWLRYGVTGEMVNDIIRLFYCQPTLSKPMPA